MKLYSDSHQAHISMRRDAHLDTVLVELMRQKGTRHVIETGTYVGTGSTTALAEALIRAGTASPRLDTIEVNPAHHRQAQANLAAYPFVRCHWGLSVGFAEAEDFIGKDAILSRHEAESDIYIDDTIDPRKFYLEEIRGNLVSEASDAAGAPAGGTPDNLLPALLRQTPATGTLILLDSAGGIGWLEFLTTLREMQDKDYLLLLDDIGHIKHYRSKRHVESAGDFQVLAAGDARGWILAEHKAAS